ncbi:MAG: M48 family metallopeptidase, partial [Bacteroidota bacterium]
MMSPEFLLTAICIITIAGFITGQVLDVLNLRNARQPVPLELTDYYDEARYRRTLDYQQAKTRFSGWSSAFSLVVSLTMLLTGGFGWLDGLLRQQIANPFLLSLAFFGIIMIAGEIIALPFSWYGTFILEARFGFNKTTPGIFWGDKAKGLLIGALIGTPLWWVFMTLVERLGSGFWIWFGIVASAFLLFMNMFYTSLLLPLFNKLTPLPEGALRDAILAYAEREDFPVENIMVMDGSKRSSKANAFFSGIGKRKKIVLFDTLIAQHTTEELVAILAHEAGHYRKGHIKQGLVISVVQVFFILWVLSTVISNENLTAALGGSVTAVHLNLIAFS